MTYQCKVAFEEKLSQIESPLYLLNFVKQRIFVLMMLLSRQYKDCISQVFTSVVNKTFNTSNLCKIKL